MTRGFAAVLLIALGCVRGHKIPPPKQYELSVAGGPGGMIRSEPGGISCGEVCAARFNQGTVVTLRATPDPNIDFGGWSGACSGKTLCSLRITGVVRIGALFVDSAGQRVPADYKPFRDIDHDGVADDVDECVVDAEDIDGFQDADGCPDPDNDGDRILDVDDECPNAPEVYNGRDDADGCPD